MYTGRGSGYVSEGREERWMGEFRSSQGSQGSH